MKVVLIMAPMCNSASVASALDALSFANMVEKRMKKDFVDGQSSDSAQKQVPKPISKPLFDITTASLDGKLVEAFGGMVLQPQTGIANFLPGEINTENGETGSIDRTIDLIIVPGFLHYILELLDDFVDLSNWLAGHHANGTKIASMCTGSFITAQAGILDGKMATTHWMYRTLFQQRFPKVNLQVRHIVTEDDGVFCSGGASAGNDLLMYMIRKFGSDELASECSKMLLLDGSRRDQSAYIMFHFRHNHADRRILEVQKWLDGNIATDKAFEEIATDSGFSPRNFIRRFKAATGETPVYYLQLLRLEKAKQLLENTDKNVEEITFDVGYSDGNSFRRLFKKHCGIPPGAYRKKFRQ